MEPIEVGSVTIPLFVTLGDERVVPIGTMEAPIVAHWSDGKVSLRVYVSEGES